MTTYTTPHNLPQLETADLIKSPTGDNLRKQINALSTASNSALEGVKTAAANDATTKANTAKSEAISAAATDATTKANQAKTDAIADATTKYGGLPARVTTLETDKWKRGNLAGSTDFNAVLTVGAYGVIAQNHPNQPVAILGSLEVLPLNTWYIQRYTTTETAPRTFVRRYAGSWGAWSQIPDAAAVTALTGRVSTLEGKSAVSKSGMKVVPLTMTAPGTPLETTTNTGAVRWVRRYAVMPKRVRVHVANANTGNALVGSAALTVTSIRVGVGDAAGGHSQGVIAASSGTLAANGAEYVTPWVTVPGLTDGGYMAVTVAWSGGGGTAKLQNNQGGGWTTTDNTQAGAADVTGWTRSQTTPLHCWVEAEVPAVTPVLLANGDSITVGTATTDPVGDSFAALYAYDHGALPVILAMHGSAMTHWTSGAVRWNQYGTFDLSPVTDAIVTTLGQNDLAGAGITLADLQTRHNTFIDALRALFPTQPVYLGHITPSTKSADVEAIRRDFNTWRATLPKGERGILDFATAVGTADGEALEPAYTADGLHPNTAGQTVMADLVESQPVTPFTLAPGKLQALSALV